MLRGIAFEYASGKLVELSSGNVIPLLREKVGLVPDLLRICAMNLPNLSVFKVAVNGTVPLEEVMAEAFAVSREITELSPVVIEQVFTR